ncbi:MAG TPA: OmpA family protein [Desulfobacterales bacterium]|nr:OmpA family protein [Desulfobacterales bacterium]
MKKNYLTPLLIVMISTLLISCGGNKVMKTASSFEPHKFDASQYEPKEDNFVVILDTSSSMDEKYNGQPKAEIAKNFLMAMNQTLPELKYNSELRIFGTSTSIPDKWTKSVYGLKSYSEAEFETALKDVKGQGGTSSLPLAKAITASGEVLKSTQGSTAVILVSDGEQMDQAPLKAAEDLKSQFGDRLCIYTVQIGDDPAGKAILEQIAKAGGCGYSTAADRLASSANMAGFVEGIFLAKSAPKPVPMAVAPKPLDSDNDGVTDNQDQCPNTPLGFKVDSKGCLASASSVVLFSFNSADIRSEAYPVLNETAMIMKKNPELNGRIDGYADSTGNEAYNIDLSERRAKAVKDFFVSRGVDPERLTIKGFGDADPVASNDTKEGRAKNRRVELTPVQ